MTTFEQIAEHAAEMMNRAKAIRDKKAEIAEARRELFSIPDYDPTGIARPEAIELETTISRLTEELRNLPKPENKAFDVEVHVPHRDEHGEEISIDSLPADAEVTTPYDTARSPALKYLLAQAEARSAEIAYHLAAEAAVEMAGPNYVGTPEDAREADRLHHEMEIFEDARLRASFALAMHNAETTIRQAEELVNEAQAHAAATYEAFETYDKETQGSPARDIQTMRGIVHRKDIAEMALDKAAQRLSEAERHREDLLLSAEIRRVDEAGLAPA